MPRRHRILLAFLLPLLLPALPSAACTLSLGWEAFEPFQLDAGGTVKGIDVDLFKAAANQIGCSVNTKELPWKRLLGDMEAGRMDAAMGASITPDRQVFANFSAPYRQDEFVLFLRKGESDKLGTEGLGAVAQAKLRVGIVGGYEYGDAFESAKKNPEFARLLQEASGTGLNLNKLLANRIDAFIENRYVGLVLVKAANAADKVEVHPTPVSSDPVYFMFGKKSVPEDVVARFDAALAAMKADGRTNAIIDSYLK